MNQHREQRPSRSEHFRRVRDIPPLNPRKVNFMQRFAKKPGTAGADGGQEKRFHFPEIFWQLRRKRSIITVDPPIAFLPRLGSLTPELFAKVFANERMSIQILGVVRICGSEQPRSP